MPINVALASKIWDRYVFLRDNGHTAYAEKADKCEKFFAGDQWDASDLAKLAAGRRPALTINKILSTVSNVMGEQINNRSEISFRPRSGAPSTTADVLTKVFRQISDNNQLDWKRSDMFADGIIGARGFLDARIEHGDSMQGEVRINSVNPKNVVIDGDADEYDPDTWSEVYTTKWLTADEIEVLYNKPDADILRTKASGNSSYESDLLTVNRDRFGDPSEAAFNQGSTDETTIRNIRILERQWRKLDRQKHFLNPETGDMRPVPEDFTQERIDFFIERYGFKIVSKLVRRIRWTVAADDVVLHDEWSPYKHFTIVPYFPHFRRGRTIGLVENLLGPQELLNKVTSQELHVVNTTANSGYKVKAGNLINMTVAELEEKGSQTGLVVEVNEMDGIDKLTPNQVPQGLDRISYKAEESIKSISGISDSMQGQDRADVAAKAIQAKQKAGSTNLVKPLDNLVRSDYILARNVIDLVQEFYTEERLMTITHDETTGESETFTINQPNLQPPPEEGMEQEGSPYEEILNDLTVGEYDVVVTSVPRRETLEDSQFEQAMALRELGIMIPESVLIDSSRIMNKKDIIKQMEAARQAPEALAAAELAQRGQAAEVSKTEAEVQHRTADAELKAAKVGEVQAKTQEILNGPQDDGGAQAKMAEVQQKGMVAEHKMGMDEQTMQHKLSIDERKLALEREKIAADADLRERESQQKRIDERNKMVMEAAKEAAKPPTDAQHANRSNLPTSKG
jgi:hypothetical protein